MLFLIPFCQINISRFINIRVLVFSVRVINSHIVAFFALPLEVYRAVGFLFAYLGTCYVGDVVVEQLLSKQFHSAISQWHRQLFYSSFQVVMRPEFC